jgi:Flp pilus assembly protein CpaB
MEAHGHFGGRIGSRRSGSNLTNRRTPVLVAILSAVMAAALIYLFVSHYHKATPAATVQTPTEMTVFVAKADIPAGTPQSTVAAEHLLKPIQVSISKAWAGAITAPSQLTSEVASAAITKGDQVTASDFIHATPTIANLLTGGWRGIAVHLDSWHGLTSYVRRGDTVNVMGGRGLKSELLFQNISVIGNSGGDVVLKMTDKEALMLDADMGNGIALWLTLRPASGAKNTVKTGLVVNP